MMQEYAQAQCTATETLGFAQQIPGQSRTFDSIHDAVGRVRATTAQVERMLNRVSPTPREVPMQATMNQAINTRPSYAASIEQLHSALAELGASLDGLEKHI